MSSREYTEWLEFAKVEPLGDDRGDLQAAIIASTIANVYRDVEKREQPFTPADFIHDFWPDDEKPAAETRQTWQEQLAMVEMLNAALGGKDERKHGNAEETAGSPRAG